MSQRPRSHTRAVVTVAALVLVLLLWPAPPRSAPAAPRPSPSSQAPPAGPRPESPAAHLRRVLPVVPLPPLWESVFDPATCGPVGYQPLSRLLTCGTSESAGVGDFAARALRRLHFRREGLLDEEGRRTVVSEALSMLDADRSQLELGSEGFLTRVEPADAARRLQRATPGPTTPGDTSELSRPAARTASELLSLQDGLGARDVAPVTAAQLSVMAEGARPHHRTAFVVHLRTCPSNMWHYTTEFVLPLFLLMARHGVFDRPRLDPASWAAAAPLVLVRAPSRMVWGHHNRGCPTLADSPYGTDAPAAWLGRVLAPHMVFFDEEGAQRGDLRRVVDARRVDATIDHLVVSGLDYTCGGDGGLFDFARLARAADRRPPWRTMKAAYPFLHTGTHRCHRALAAFRDTVGALVGAPPASPRVTAEELRCPDVVVLSRQGAANGRHVENWDEAVGPALEAALLSKDDAGRPCGSIRVVPMHELSPREQFATVRNATFVVAVRGAATALTAFLRPGAGLLLLFPAHTSVRVSTDTDNAPWWPFATLRHDIAVAIAGCSGVTNRDPQHGLMCRRRSVNFCNMRCGKTHVAAMATALRRGTVRLLREPWRDDLAGNATAVADVAVLADAAKREAAAAATFVVPDVVESASTKGRIFFKDFV